MKNQLLPSDVRHLFAFDPINGVLYRKVGRPRDCNKPAGCIRSRGYIKISVHNKAYLAHRLIWMWRYGSFDNECIDHINGITSDNRLENLRCVSYSDNQNNQYRNRYETTNSCQQELPEQSQPEGDS